MFQGPLIDGVVVLFVGVDAVAGNYGLAGHG
ncbi:MAG: hypothetical protein KatS3mg111_2859 [Pirellulaceae bacterium]|nr:MAG: hypothetical protein KatS3mg111_2859 [Pirellulaceae bacterium]